MNLNKFEIKSKNTVRVFHRKKINICLWIDRWTNRAPLWVIGNACIVSGSYVKLFLSEGIEK